MEHWKKISLIFVLLSLVLPKPVVATATTGNSLLEKILFYENRRLSNPDLLGDAVKSGSREVRKAAVLALGRIGDSSRLDELANLISKKDREMREYAIFSLSLMGEGVPLMILQQNIPMQKEWSTLAALYVGIGHAGEKNSLKKLSTLLTPKVPPVLAGSMAEALGILFSKAEPDWEITADTLAELAQLAARKGTEAKMAAFALSRYKGEGPVIPTAPIVKAYQSNKNPDVRPFLARIMGKIGTSQVNQLLMEGLSQAQPVALRVESVKALAQQEFSTDMLNQLNAALGDSSSHVVIQALSGVLRHSSNFAPATPSLETLVTSHRSFWVRGKALQTLAIVNPQRARVYLNAIVKTPSHRLIRDAIIAIGRLRSSEDIPAMTGFLKNNDILIAGAAVEAITYYEDDQISPPIKAALQELLESGDPAMTTMIAQMARRHRWKEFNGSLVKVYPLLKQPEHLEAKVAVLNAVSVIGDKSHLGIVQLAMRDPQKQVVEAAANSLKTLTGRDLASKIPLNSKVTSPTPDLGKMKLALGKKVVLKTNRGEIHMKMLDDAPMTVLNFVDLVRTGFYDGKTFHRVVPNFVVQGGDPRGDGYGGPGYFIRDELSPTRHDRGTVGMATAGKDTGGSQFFFNLWHNYHLNRRYTVFAEVTQGMSVVEKLEEGDRILSASIR